MNSELGTPINYSIHRMDDDMVAFFFSYIPGLKSASVENNEIILQCEGLNEAYLARISSIPGDALDQIKKVGCYLFGTDPVRVCFEEKIAPTQFN